MPDGRIQLLAGRGTITPVPVVRDQNSYPGTNASLGGPQALAFEQNAFGGRLVFVEGTSRRVRTVMCAAPGPGGTISDQAGNVLSGCLAGLVCEPGTTTSWGASTFKPCGPL